MRIDGPLGMTSMFLLHHGGESLCTAAGVTLPAPHTSPQLPIGPLEAITEPVPSEPPMSQ